MEATVTNAADETDITAKAEAGAGGRGVRGTRSDADTSEAKGGGAESDPPARGRATAVEKAEATCKGGGVVDTSSEDGGKIGAACASAR